MNSWISMVKGYLNKFLELGVLLLGVSVIAEIIFGPNVAFFGSQITNNLITLLNSLGEQGIAALIVTLQPVLTNALAGPVLNEKVTWNKWLGVLLGFVGAVGPAR